MTKAKNVSKSKSKSKVKAQTVSVNKGDITLTGQDRQDLKDFVNFAIGDPHLSSWEENFLNTCKRKLIYDTLYFTERQLKVVNELKEKLHFYHQSDPLPTIDPDGVYENDDPDGYPPEQDGENADIELDDVRDPVLFE